MVRRCVIQKPREKEGPDPQGAVAPETKFLSVDLDKESFKMKLTVPPCLSGCMKHPTDEFWL